jgi:hypothetical protein
MCPRAEIPQSKTPPGRYGRAGLLAFPADGGGAVREGGLRDFPAANSFAPDGTPATPALIPTRIEIPDRSFSRFRPRPQSSAVDQLPAVEAEADTAAGVRFIHTSKTFWLAKVGLNSLAWSAVA